MSTIRFFACSIVGCLLSTAGLTGDRSMSFGGWANKMLSELHFVSGSLYRRDYRMRSDNYLSFQHEYYQNLHSSRNSNAEVAQRRIAAMMDSAENYVRSSEEGIFRSLDPDGKGVVTRSEATERLLHIAHAADLDADCRLDADEASFAEAALAQGINLRDKSEKTRLLQFMSINGGYPE